MARKKHQQSSIDRLPEDIRTKLQELLRDPRVTQLAATEKINDLLDMEGRAERVSKSAVNRYAVRMDEVGARLRETREIAKMWIGELGAEPAGEVGKLLNELVRNLAFKAAMTANESPEDAPVDPKMLKSLAVSVYRLERAARENLMAEENIRKQEREKLLAATNKIAKKNGLSDETVAQIRKSILGIA